MIEQSCIRIERPPKAESEPSQDFVSNDQSEDDPDKQHTSWPSGNGPFLYAHRECGDGRAHCPEKRAQPKTIGPARQCDSERWTDGYRRLAESAKFEASLAAGIKACLMELCSNPRQPGVDE